MALLRFSLLTERGHRGGRGAAGAGAVEAESRRAGDHRDGPLAVKNAHGADGVDAEYRLGLLLFFLPFLSTTSSCSPALGDWPRAARP